MLIDFSTIFKKYNMNINGVIHIGAHYGEEVQEYIRHGIHTIVMFEPLSENFNVLQRNIQNLNAKIVCHQVALGSTSGNVEMYVSSNDKQSSSILKPKVHLTQHPNVLFPTTEVVEMKTLDDYGINNANFINIDVQGYELEVFKGALNTLPYIDYIYCEVNRDQLYENNAMIEEIDEFLKSYNFERVETDWAGDTWGDALYVKNNLL